MKSVVSYQEVDKKIRAIKIAIHNSEERKKAFSLNSFLTSVEESVLKMEKKAEELSAKFSQLKKDYNKANKAIVQLENAVQDEDDIEELKVLEKKIAQSLEVFKKLDNDMSNLIKDMEETEKSYADIKKKFRQAKDEFVVAKSKYDEMMQGKNEEIAVLTKQLQTIEKKIDPELLALYNKKKAEKVFPVFVKLNQDSYCGGCSTELSLNEKNTLNQNNYIECENCRRIVYKE